MNGNNNNREVAIKLSGVKKQYKLGQIGGGTLTADLQSWWARIRGKEDPNSIIGTDQRLIGKTFMALNGIDLTVYKGEALGIIGGNGAGKSTTLKLLSRVTAPTEGEIDIYGRITSMLEVGTGFNGELTGRENVYMNGAILGMTKAEIDAKMEDIIEFSEVRDFIDTPVKRYSSGMYVKLAFSVAAHLDSEIMIMDEVLAVGDMAFQKKCLDKMRDAAKKQGRTVLYVSHNMNTIRQLCDRCVVLDQGRIIFEGDVSDAIGIYYGNKSTGFPNCYELLDAPRPSAQHGEHILIDKFEFLDCEQAIFKRTNPMKFRITFNAINEINDLKLYFAIRAGTGEPVGLAQTYVPFVNAVGNTKYAFDFSLDCSNFVEGNYSISPDLFSNLAEGKHYSVDHPLCEIKFKIIDDSPIGVEWNSKYFGHIRTNPIQVLSGNIINEDR